MQPRDAAREHRAGRRLSRDEARARSGIATVYDSAELEPFLRAVLDRRPYPPRAYTAAVAEPFARALAEGRARVALDLGGTPDSTRRCRPRTIWPAGCASAPRSCSSSTPAPRWPVCAR